MYIVMWTDFVAPLMADTIWLASVLLGVTTTVTSEVAT
jgi:hypothetical protein